MSSYPILLESQAMDLTSLVEMTDSAVSDMENVKHDMNAVYSDGTALELESTLSTSFTENNLTDFKKYLDDENSKIHNYIGENGIVYSYNPAFDVFAYDPDGSTLYASKGTQMLNMEKEMFENMGMSADSMAGFSNFDELLPGQNELISKMVYDNYQVIHGDWPSEYNEVILVLNERNEIPTSTLYQLGLLSSADYEGLMKKIDAGEKVEIETETFTYEEICSKEFSLIPQCDLYKEKDNGTFEFVGDDLNEIEELLDSSIKLKITGVIKPVEDAENLTITSNLAYTRALTEHLIEHTDSSPVVKAQLQSPDVNVLSNLKFAPEDDSARIEDAKTYLTQMGVSDKAKICKDMLYMMYMQNPEAAQQMMQMGEAELAALLDGYLQDPEDDVLLSIYDRYISTGNYDDNMTAFGVVSVDAPSSIALYCDSFEAKDRITACIDEYNQGATEENKITFTDYIGLLLSSVTTIVNVISYVLIAFVSVSLVVSSIMIGIITYISVLERTKEIGILRAVGASKRNISQVFLSETFIIGLCAGLIGVGVTLLLLIPANAIIQALAGTAIVSAALPVNAAVILVLLSVLLTAFAGLFPARKAARKDPVTALRTE